eukprot:COSAG01_NODE_5669_length_4105_cov_18.145922_2_plen_475_part_00
MQPIASQQPPPAYGCIRMMSLTLKVATLSTCKRRAPSIAHSPTHLPPAWMTPSFPAVVCSLCLCPHSSAVICSCTSSAVFPMSADTAPVRRRPPTVLAPATAQGPGAGSGSGSGSGAPGGACGYLGACSKAETRVATCMSPQLSANKTCPAGCQTKIDAMYGACSSCGGWYGVGSIGWSNSAYSHTSPLASHTDIQSVSGCSAPAPPPCVAACIAKTQAAACAGTDCRSSCDNATAAASCSWAYQASATKTCPAGCQTKIDAMYVACSGCGNWDDTKHVDMTGARVPLAASIRSVSGCTESQAQPKAKTCPAGCQTKIDAMYGTCAGCENFDDAGRQAQSKETFRSRSGCAPGGSPSIGNSGGGNSGAPTPTPTPVPQTSSTPSPVLSPPPLPPVIFAEITLDINVETIAAGTPQRAAFETDFKRDLSLELGGIDTARIIIVEVKAASAMVAFEILPDPSSNILCVCSLDALLK